MHKKLLFQWFSETNISYGHFITPYIREKKQKYKKHKKAKQISQNTQNQAHRTWKYSWMPFWCMTLYIDWYSFPGISYYKYLAYPDSAEYQAIWP